MAKQKFYVVWEGVKPGIYDNWEQCQLSIKGFRNAKYKAFPSLHAAEAAYKRPYHESVGSAVNLEIHLEGLQENQPKPVFPSLAVDAACNVATGDMEYRGVDAQSGREIFRLGPFKDGTNNIGEFLAIVHGLAFLKQNNSDLPIYTDSLTAMGWVRKKKANTKQLETFNNAKLFELIGRAEKWLRENSWKNKLLKWETHVWGEIPADFGRK